MNKFASRFFYGHVVVAISFLIMVAILGLHASFGVFFKPVIADLGWTRAVISGSFALSNIVHGLISIVMGWLNDRFGPRLVLTICGLLSGIGYVLMSKISEVWHLYLFFGVVVGAGSAIFVPLLSTIARWYVHRRSMMSGVVVAGVGVGLFVMPLLANNLILTYEWRTACMILGIAIAIFVVLAAQLLKRDPSQTNQVAYGADKEEEIGPKNGARAFTLGKAISTWQFWIVFTMFFCLGFCVFAMQIHIVPYATDQGITVTAAAIVLAVIGVASIIGQIALGSAGDKIGNRKGFIIGFVLLAFSIIWLLLTRQLWALYLFAVIFGIGWGGNSTQESPLVAGLFGLASHGLIYGIVCIGFTVGAATGPLLAGIIFDITGNYILAFSIAGATGFLGIILASVLRTIKYKSPYE